MGSLAFPGACSLAMAMKAMKAMKAMVFRGSKTRTVGGLKAGDLTKNKGGKIVSKRMSLRAKRAFQGSSLQKWGKAVQRARRSLSVSGFVAIKKGTPLYRKAREIFTA